MKKAAFSFRAYLAALLMLSAVPAEAADVKELFAIDLADSPGKEGRMIEVSYPPGARDMVHRHNAHAFVYVLEGEVYARSAIAHTRCEPPTLPSWSCWLTLCAGPGPQAFGEDQKATL